MPFCFKGNVYIVGDNSTAIEIKEKFFSFEIEIFKLSITTHTLFDKDEDFLEF